MWMGNSGEGRSILPSTRDLDMEGGYGMGWCVGAGQAYEAHEVRSTSVPFPCGISQTRMPGSAASAGAHAEDGGIVEGAKLWSLRNGYKRYPS